LFLHFSLAVTEESDAIVMTTCVCAVSSPHTFCFIALWTTKSCAMTVVVLQVVKCVVHIFKKNKLLSHDKW